MSELKPCPFCGHIPKVSHRNDVWCGNESCTINGIVFSGGPRHWNARSTQASLGQVPEGLHPDTAELVLNFAQALAEKLYAAQQKYGYSDNWRRSNWENECRAELLRHVAKGDPRDVAAYCAFLWYHGQSTAGGQASMPPVPEDWQIVPKEPTPEMVRAGENAPSRRFEETRTPGIYCAMLVAAPLPHKEGE